VEGLVHITELGGEYFRYDDVRHELRGERTGIRHAVGGRIRVQVSRVDLDGRKIDFRLVREAEELTQRALRDKGLPPAGQGVAADKRSVKKVPSADRAPRSPIQALQADVKKASARNKSAKSRKPRR
jgi:ribonuclease R